MHREIDHQSNSTFVDRSAAAMRLTVDGRFLSRGGRRARIHGMAYGPFAPNSLGEPFPEPNALDRDFARMKAIGVNALRIYQLPSPRFLDAVSRQEELGVVVDVPWSKHLCFLDSRQACRDARRAVREAAVQCRHSPAVLAYSIGNEIPADIVRWHGAHRVERFLAELADVARQADPGRLVTYANYPPTEYLDLSFLDYATFNVYLHDPETFRRYLLRLLNLVGDKPLILGEIGMDTIRHGEEEQAAFLTGHIRVAEMLGLSGTFVFSWTDDWFTGEHQITDWAFGITNADRSPKISYRALGDAFAATPVDLLSDKPRVSVVVCSYNGGSTLAQCLESLASLNYPDYEIILVDDGSTDDTRSIAARFPQINAIHQPNSGLSAARNVGLKAATGSIVAYTDADCLPHPDWLTYLVHKFNRYNAAAVGGPNLAPPAGRVAACVAAGPGQPMHVLESDQVAEHIPGCNMAFRRAALEAINGFDPQFQRAGDDVDICWRLQAVGCWITFAPSAVVWHHRRQTPKAYFKQQAGYGEAEALLRFKHPDRFNGNGQGKWSGSLYGASLQGLVLDEAIIYRGTFGTSPFQCIYQPGPAHWAMVPSTLEWHMAAATVGLLGLLIWPLLALAAAMLLLSGLVAGLQAYQARLPRCHDGPKSRLLIAALCYMQPLVRAWARYKTRYFAFQAPAAPPLPRPTRYASLLQRNWTVAYWGPKNPERTQLIQRLVTHLDAHRCGKTIDTGWTDTDLQVFRDVWAVVAVSTVQEEHGSENRVIRVRAHLHTSRLTKILAVLGCIVIALGAWISIPLGVAWTLTFLFLLFAAWYRGSVLASKLIEIVDELAVGMGLVPCSKEAVPVGTCDPGSHRTEAASQAETPKGELA